MHYRIMLSFYGLIIAMAAFATSASAVSLGKIDVASHLGEPFYAEVPLSLDEGESISTVYVELAAPADYRILEVYRDQALNAIRADVENDSRGSRVELTSRSVMDAPFFNLVLKVRQGRATHYKKYPIFLDLPRAAQSQQEKAPLPTVSYESSEKAPSVASVTPVQPIVEETPVPEETAAPTTAFKPYDGWARTSHYGPMVYGDTISTVADRLRVDGRYTRNQVMVALFEKNRSKFEQDNINLIQAGTHLDIPQAAEVERISPEQAHTVIKDHNQRWRELVKQPRYAAVKEAQETRYSKRVRVGKEASGAAAAPVSSQMEEGEEANTEPTTTTGQVSDVTPAAESEGSVDGAVSGQGDAETSLLMDNVAKLQQENEALQAKLAETDAKLAELSAAGSPDAQVAAEARVKKLELQLARLQSELDSAKQSSVASSEPDWLMLGGGALVLLLLGGGAGYLMRRERKHPAMVQTADAFVEEPLPDTSLDEEPEEIEVESVEEFSPDATAQMNADDFEQAFSDSIPDLTDEETGEMEAFTEDLEEEPDPNVDYLSEADVYLRYGMEDEAEKQVALALKLRENNPDAHAKLVQIRKGRGDEAGADEAIATARTVLAGDLLSTFESTVSTMVTGEVDTSEAALDDTIPPGTLDVAGDADVAESLEADGEIGDLDDIEFGDVEVSPAEVATAGSDDATISETTDLGDLEWPSLDDSSEADSSDHEETVVDRGNADEATIVDADIAEDFSDDLPELEDPAVEEATESVDDTAASTESGGLDFDLSGLELPDEGDADSQPEEKEDVSSLLQETGEEVEAAAPSTDEEEAIESMDLDSFDLSDLDLSGGDNAADESAAVEEPKPEVLTADLDKTVVMDWSKETLTSGDHEIGGESGADEIDFGDSDLSMDAADEPAEVAPEAELTPEPEVAPEVDAAPAAEIEEPESHLSSVEFDLEDLDVDLDTPRGSDDLDDFSSTIQTNIEEIKGSGNTAAKESPATDLDSSDDAFGLEPLDEESDDGVSAEGVEGSLDSLRDDTTPLEDLVANSGDKDFDATMELDSLLSQLSLDEDDDSSDDKDKKE